MSSSFIWRGDLVVTSIWVGDEEEFDFAAVLVEVTEFYEMLMS